MRLMPLLAVTASAAFGSAGTIAVQAMSAVPSTLGPDISVHRQSPSRPGFFCEGTREGGDPSKPKRVFVADKPNECACIDALKVAAQ